MLWKYIGFQIVVLGCPYPVLTFCNGNYHVNICGPTGELDEYHGGVEKCNGKHSIEKEVDEIGQIRLSAILEKNLSAS